MYCRICDRWFNFHLHGLLPSNSSSNVLAKAKRLSRRTVKNPSFLDGLESIASLSNAKQQVPRAICKFQRSSNTYTDEVRITAAISFRRVFRVADVHYSSECSRSGEYQTNDDPPTRTYPCQRPEPTTASDALRVDSKRAQIVSVRVVPQSHWLRTLPHNEVDTDWRRGSQDHRTESAGP